MRLFLRLLRYLLILGVLGVVFGCAAIAVAYWLIAPRLPAVESLKDVRLQVPLRVYTADNRLIATFGETRRIPVKIDKIPAQLKNAFIAAEDSRFYEHPGFDWQGVIRAGLHVVFTGGEKTQGASTITQQVARNFFLSSEKSYTRKLSELFLARRIEQALSKDEILELYLNKIFLGNRAYGVAAAAEFYYGKTLDQLTLAESAMLASLPKFPSTGNPLNNRARAVERSNNYVLQRMLENKFITADQFKEASAEPDLSYAHEPPIEVEAPYLAELVRRDVLERLGNDALTDGFTVHTTLVARAQDAADQALRDDLVSYDQRHGYRGPEAHVELTIPVKTADLDHKLDAYHPVVGLVPGIVTEAEEKSALVYLDDGQSVPLDLSAVSWAQAYKDESHRGGPVKHIDALLKPGDIVRLARNPDGKWKLSQIPVAQGALLALNPEDGAIVAEVGGFSYARSKFNRAVQSNRQPGSSFKPYFYAAAFEHGFTPASIVNDAPIVFADPSKPNGLWTPKNDDDKFEGPMRLREAMVLSKNLVSVRLLDAIGVRYAREYASRFGIPIEQIPDNLSMALGTASVSPLMMARGFAVFANGGFLVDPYFIESIQDRDGKEVYKAHPVVACRRCPERLREDARIAATQTAAEKSAGEPARTMALSVVASAQAAPANAAAADPGKPLLAPRVLDARIAYLVGSLLHDVVRRGTGHDAMVLKRNDLAGKTGSTNDHRDAWFTGYNDSIVASTWVGFDDFSSLGRANGVGEFGAQAALPMWIGFMREALKGLPEKPFEMPSGITTARIDPETGQLAASGDAHSMLEVFKVEDIARLAAGPNNPTEQEKRVQQDAYGIF